MTLRDWLFAGVALVVGVLCVRLGFWQLSRLETRRERNALIERRTQLPPIDLNQSLPLRQDVEFRPARARGEFDVEREMVLSGRTYDGRAGVHLLTPLRLPGSNLALLVDRGWVPFEAQASGDFSHYQPSGSVEVEGLLRGSLETPTFLFWSGPSGGGEAGFQRTWRTVDIPAIQEQMPYPLVPYYLVVTESPRQPAAGPTPNLSLDLSEGPHLGYAIQWFAFAAIAVFGGGYWIYKQAGAGSGQRHG